LVAAIVWVALSLRRGDNSGADLAGVADDMAGMEMSTGGDGSVQISASQLTQFGITFASVEDRVLAMRLRTVGIVTTAEDMLAHVAPKAGGFVETLFVEKTGEEVRRGDALATIFSPNLIAAQEELLIAQRLTLAAGDSIAPGITVGSMSLLQAARQRMRLWDIADAEIESVLASGRVQRTLTLYSPITGIILEKRVVEGQSVGAGELLYAIADLATVWVEAELREGQIGMVREGTSAQIEVASLPEQKLVGRVEFINPVLQPDSRTGRARIAVRNSERLLKPGMYATVYFTTPDRRALTVPSSAVMHTGERAVVFVDRGAGRITPAVVKTGQTTDDLVEVLSGLEPGQRVVTSAQFILDSESNLADVMRSMIGMGAADAAPMAGMDMSSPTAGTARDMKGMKMPPDTLPDRAR
jgi:Cu(I)/Ag(I) efflux system membrane fusion protein